MSYLKSLKIQNNFIQVYLWTSLVFSSLSVFILSYFKQFPTEILSHPIIDGNCNLKMQGIGEHCFSDFYGPLRFSTMDSPWAGGNNTYPPLATKIMEPFLLLSNSNVNSRLSLALFLFACLVCILIPAALLFRLKHIDFKTMIKCQAFVLSSAPILVALDRGNFIVLLIPVIFLVIYFGLKENTGKFFIVLSLLICLRPQFLVSMIVYVLLKYGFRKAIQKTIIAFTIFVGTFVIYPGNIVANALDYLETLKGYSSYQFVGEPWPVNLSFSNFILTIIRIFLELFNPTSLFNKDFILIRFANIPVLVCFICLIVFHKKFWQNSTNFEVLSLSLMAAILLPSVSYSYYLIVFLLLMIYPVFVHEKTFPKYFSNVTSEKLFGLTALAIFINFQLPWKLIPSLSEESWSQISLSWMFGQLLLMILFTYLLIAKKQQLQENNAS